MLPENLIKFRALTSFAPPNINSGGPGCREVDLLLTAGTPGATLPKSIKMILAEPNLVERSPIVNSPKVRNPTGVSCRAAAELTNMNPRHEDPREALPKANEPKAPGTACKER